MSLICAGGTALGNSSISCILPQMKGIIGVCKEVIRLGYSIQMPAGSVFSFVMTWSFPNLPGYWQKKTWKYYLCLTGQIPKMPIFGCAAVRKHGPLKMNAMW